jgi:hypothetical protein
LPSSRDVTASGSKALLGLSTAVPTKHKLGFEYGSTRKALLG